MTTLSQLLNLLQQQGQSTMQIKLRYLHPILYALCVDDAFSGLEFEERFRILARRVGLPETELQSIVARGSVQLTPITPLEMVNDYGFLESDETGQHWLAWYANGTTSKCSVQSLEVTDSARALHFYGFKGGQARSTVMVLLAKLLADDGMRVLVVDADLEAPSLDSVFDVTVENLSATLMGLCGWDNEIRPHPRVYVGRQKQGIIDLIACRPRPQIFDMDFAGFLLGSMLDARLVERAATRLRDFAKDQYDYVLFDHRTGLAPSVLPLMSGWPGSTVVFLRPDGMSRHAEQSSALDALLGHDVQSPGAFVTFSLDPKETSGEFLGRHGKFVERLLEHLSDALKTGTDDIDPSELQRYWILWNHDASLLGQSPPSPDQLGSLNRAALARLREVLGITHQIESKEPTLTKSGASDDGLFILTPDIARLFSKDSRILYIFGRKGTGKTRLVKELSARKWGTPLLVAQDFNGGGIQSGGTAFNNLLKRCKDDYETFWWGLLLSALRFEADSSTSLAAYVDSLAQSSVDDLATVVSANVVERHILGANQKDRHVFLIDGVETAVPAAKLRQFVESLFRFLASVQYSRTISMSVSIRLFLRTDLHKNASQNIEQQIEGLDLHLRWDRKSILNFAVARIHSLPWFKLTFPDVWKEIDDQLPAISRGGLSELEVEDMLLGIFPTGLERNKLKTTTFLATYFSDAGGDSDAKASFYPRLFDGFLRTMDSSSNQQDALLGDRLSSGFVLRSYDKASSDFIEEVRTELHNLLDIVEDDTDNRQAVNTLLEAFSGLKTPFMVEEIVEEILKKYAFPPERLRDSLNKMKQLGIFEDRPGYPGWWRTGRLYKSGLNMKYVRTPKVSL